MFVTSEFVLINPELNEINNIKKNTQLKFTRKYGYNYDTEVNVKINVQYFDEIENKTKHIMIEHDNVIGVVNKIMQSSKRMINFFKALELTYGIQGRIHRNVVSAY